MEKYEELKVKHKSLKAFKEEGLLITFEMLFENSKEKKTQFEDFYKKKKDIVNELIIMGLENYEIQTYKEFAAFAFERYLEEKEMNSLPERFREADDSEIRKEFEEWFEFYESDEIEEDEEDYRDDIIDLLNCVFVKVEGDEDDYIVSFKKDTNLEDIGELEEMIEEEIKKNHD